jgi:zeaxanthin glucosyltransferase
MHKVAFSILDTHSHYNATFKIAEEIKSRGNDVLYYGHEKYRDVVTSNGYNFISIPCKYSPEVKLTGNRVKDAREIISSIECYSSSFLEGTFFDKLLKDYNPDVIILDASLVYFSFLLLKRKKKFVLLSTKACLDKHSYIPPLSSNYIPKKSHMNRLFVEFLWIKYFVKRFFQNWWEVVNPLKVSNLYLAKQYAKKENINLKKVVQYNRFRHIGIKCAPEVIISPKEFDFPRNISNGQFYISPFTSSGRNEIVDIDKSLIDFINSAPKNSNKVFCAFGTYNKNDTQKKQRFLQHVIKAFSQKQNMFLVLATDKSKVIDESMQLPDNIFLAKYIPQLYILQNVDLMINHGGMRTIEECIVNTVPMIVYPLDLSLDQNGNAARVHYHGLGMIGDMKKETCHGILNKVEYMLDNIVLYPTVL